MKFPSPSRRNESGFTMTELLVVIGILAVLTMIAVPSYLAQRKATFETSLKADLSAVAFAIEDAKSFTGKYPTVSAANIKSVLGVDIKPESKLQIYTAGTTTKGSKPCIEGYHQNNATEYWYIDLTDRNIAKGKCSA